MQKIKKFKPTLLLMFGHPGSGKTYFSERLAKKEGFVHISSDHLRHSVLEHPLFLPQENKFIFGLMDYLAEAFLKHDVSLIYDANSNRKIYRSRLQKLAKQYGASCVTVWIHTKQEIALKRIDTRAKTKHPFKMKMYRPLDTETFTILRDSMEFPDQNEKVIELDGHKPFSEQYKHFKKQFTIL